MNREEDDNIVARSARRHMTVMFCDIVGSTQLSERLDPEDFRDVLVIYQRLCLKQIKRYGGSLAKFLGDGIMVYFGFPMPVEHCGLGAARAALGIQKSIADYPWRERAGLEEALQVRIGIDSGMVVAGDMETGEHNAIVGAAPHIASRLQGLAAPGEVMVSAATFDLFGGTVTTEFLGEKSLRGVSAKIGVHKVLASNGAEEDFPVRRSATDRRMVGRADEMEILKRGWATTRSEGRSLMITVVGEAGIGKSRLLAEFRAHAREAGGGGEAAAALVLLSATPFDTNTSYFAVREWLIGEVFAEREFASLDSALEKAERLLKLCGGEDPINAALVAGLLDQTVPPPMASGLTPEAQDLRLQCLFDGVLRFVGGGKPILVMFEDLHWIDPSTLAWLKGAKQRFPDEAVMFVAVSRPGVASIGSLDADGRVDLSGLDDADAETLANAVAGAPLPTPLLGRLVDRAGGNPLFLEELTRGAVKSKRLELTDGRYHLVEPDLDLPVPASLEESLLYRLERLGPARELAQTVAIFTGPVPLSMVAQIWDGPVAQLRDHFATLEEAGILRAVDVDRGDADTWQFRHELVRESAYRSILRVERRRLHRYVAQLLSEDDTLPGFGRPEVISRHLIFSGAERSALPHLLSAGRAALQRSAYLESIKHLETAIGVVERHGPMDAEELQIRLLLGAAYVSVRGFAADEVLDCYHRAEQLSRKLSPEQIHFAAHWGLWVYYLVRGELSKAEAFAGRLLGLGEEAQDDSLLVEGTWTLGNTRFWMGDLASSRALLERAGSLYDRERHAANAYLYGQDPGVSALCYLSFAQWYSGDKAQGLATVEAALTLAEDLRHPHSEAWALGFATIIHLVSNRMQRAEQLALRTLEFSHAQIMPFWEACGATFYGLTLVRQGKTGEGRKMAEQGYAGCKVIGAMVLQPLFAAMLAECRLADGDGEGAMEVVAEGMARVRDKGEWICAPPLLLIRGLYHLQGGDLSEAETAWWEGLQISENNGSASFSLDLVAQLAGLTLSDERADRVRRLLSSLVGRFAGEDDGGAPLQLARVRLAALEAATDFVEQ